eukprot:176173_1
MSVGKLVQDTIHRLFPHQIPKFPRFQQFPSFRKTIASTTTAFLSYRSISTTTMTTPSKQSTTINSKNHILSNKSHINFSSSSSSTTKLNDNTHSVIILGSGPAGLTAALYASRANLSPMVLEGNEAGGQLTTTTDVENFPGFPDGILGYDLIMNMKTQTEKFGTIFKQEHVESVDFSMRPFKLNTYRNTYYCDTLIIASGASAKYLGLENEQRLIGHGVSACATCDGWFFKGQEIAVIGGGDTAMEEANFLTKFASKVYIIHRRDEFRASQIMQDKTFNNDKVEILWNTVVIDVLGKNKVEGLKLKSLKDNKEYILNVTGLFLGIGHTPNTQPFVGSGLKMDQNGYIIVEPGTVNTNIKGIYACGDVQDLRYKQAITAAGTGCMAAMDAAKFLHDNEGQPTQSKL